MAAGWVIAEAGGLPGDQRAIAAAGTSDIDDMLMELADRAVAGLGDAVTVQVQPQDRCLGAVIAGLGAAGGLMPAAGARQPAGRRSG